MSRNSSGKCKRTRRNSYLPYGSAGPKLPEGLSSAKSLRPQRLRDVDAGCTRRRQRRRDDRRG
jgi:hypothetical protein